MASPSIIEFITDEEVLGRYFQGRSWRPWKAVFKAAFGLTPARYRALRVNRLAH